MKEEAKQVGVEKAELYTLDREFGNASPNRKTKRRKSQLMD